MPSGIADCPRCRASISALGTVVRWLSAVHDFEIDVRFLLHHAAQRSAILQAKQHAFKARRDLAFGLTIDSSRYSRF